MDSGGHVWYVRNILNIGGPKWRVDVDGVETGKRKKKRKKRGVFEMCVRDVMMARLAQQIESAQPAGPRLRGRRGCRAGCGTEINFGPTLCYFH
jgi:hypothetical protein